jgi:hypothetical protein
MIKDAELYVANMTDFPLPTDQPGNDHVPLGFSCRYAENQAYDAQINYYNAFWKIYTKNETNLKRMYAISNESSVLRSKIT